MNNQNLIRNLVKKQYSEKKEKNNRYSFRAHAKHFGISIATYSGFISSHREVGEKVLRKIVEKLPEQSFNLNELVSSLKIRQVCSDSIEINEIEFDIKVKFYLSFSTDKGQSLALAKINIIKEALLKII